MSEQEIAFIHHGIPDTPFIDSSFYEDKFGVEGRVVLLTSSRPFHDNGGDGC